jgi:imidazolonepropionase-like amidohydrolase
MILVCLVAGCGDGGSSADKGKAEDPAVAAGSTYYFGARIIPGDGTVIDNGVFIVENGKITSLAKEGEIKPPREAGRVELTGYTITPVFINLHGHPGVSKGGSVSASNYTRQSVLADIQRYGYYGVEAVLSAGTDKGDIAFNLRDEQRSGKVTAARLYTSGRGIAPRGGGPAAVGDIPIEVATPVDAKKAVEDEVARKVDAITIWMDDGQGKGPKLSPDIYKVVVNEAHKNNLKVFAHVFALADAKDLVAAGVDGLLQSIRDREVDDALIADMKSKNVFLTPTLTAHEARFIYAEKTDWLGEQLMREAYPPGLSAYLRDQVTMNRFRRNPELAALKQQYATAVSNLKKMVAAGVKIALGSDSGSADTFPGYFDLREMMMMAEAGMTPMQVIQASTSVPGEILGADIGLLAVGKSADFLTFNSSPAEKIDNLRSMGQLYINGAEVQRSSLIPEEAADAPRITKEDRERDARAEAAARQKAIEDAMPHYAGLLLNNPAASVRGVSVPYPRGGKVSIQAGPPSRITLSRAGTSAATMRQFFVEALPVYKWKASGNCWERPNPAGKIASLCVEAAANSATITINEK